jgi:hypothetical protein
MGSWGGLTSAEIDDGWPNARHGLGAHAWFFHSPDGERYDDMSARVRAVLGNQVTVYVLLLHPGFNDQNRRPVSVFRASTQACCPTRSSGGFR